MAKAVVAHPMPYTFGDSEDGIAASGGKALGVDINGRTCLSNDRKYRIVIIAHWPRWWLHGYEPKPGKIVPKVPFEQLTLAQVKNLRSVDGHHEILTATEAINACKDAGIVPVIEMKPSVWTIAAVRAVMDYAKSVRMPVVWSTIQAYGKTAAAKAAWQSAAFKRMQLVKRLGGHTMLLYRRPFAWARWEPVLSAIKGHAGHGTTKTARELLTPLHKAAVAAQTPPKPGPKVYPPPSPPFVEARWYGGAQKPKTIVIHGTVSPCQRGGARAVARFFANRPASGKTSAHYTVDPFEVIQSVGDHSVAYHCGYNQDSIGIELCDPQSGSGKRWADKNHMLMLARAATLVAQLCLAYGIPATRVTPSALTAGKHGICGHVDMSKAFRRSTHTDPGPDFPWTDFIHQVKAEITRLK